MQAVYSQAVVVRGWGQPGHWPGWKGLCPGRRTGPKLIELTQRLNNMLQ